MSREINYNNLVYDFKGPTSSISSTEFGGPIYTYDQLKNGDKTLQRQKKNKKKIKSEFGQIKSGDPEKNHRSN